MGKTYRLLLVAVVILWIPVWGLAQNSPAQTSQGQSSQTQNSQAESSQTQNSQAQQAQQAPAPTNTPGPTAFFQVAGTRSPLGSIYNGAVGVGYNITKHFGGDVGIPLYTVQSPFSIVTNHDWRWTTLLGDPFIDLRYTTKHLGMNMTSILTASIPISSATRVFSTGRVGVDWFNHIETHYMGFTPFLNFGAANETVDRYVLPRPYNIARPYQSFGFISDFEAGTNYTILKHYSVGASAYALVPAGPQKVFSRLVSPDSAVAGDSNHFRYWNSAFETKGNSTIAKDNGYSGWVQVSRFKNLTVQVGYTYSIHYALGTAFVLLRFDGTSLIRYLTATQ